MIGSQNSMQPLLSFGKDFLLYDQQSLCALVLDAINEIAILNLISEGNKLLEAMDGEIHIEEIATIITNLNNQLLQHVVKMNALRCKM